MRGSLYWKLMAVFAVVILISVGGTLALASRYAEGEFRRYVGRSQWQEAASALASYYTTHGSWEGVGETLARGRGQGQGGGPPVRLADAQGRIVLDEKGTSLGQLAGSPELETGLPVIIDGKQVGTLLVPGGGQLTAEQEAFLQRLVLAFALAGSAAVVVALVLGALLVRSITRPLGQLTLASHAVASGNLETRVPVRSRDEVGQLADAFNRMASGLARAEEARRQQSADIAHELRTPLTVIQGQLEAIADGLFPADTEHLEPVLAQTHLLNRLVADLRTLSLADAGQLDLSPVRMDIGEWVYSTVAGFRAAAAERSVALDTEIAAGLPEVTADPVRISQVLGNLLDNALRHTPDGGQITVRAARQGDSVAITVTDTGPGVAPQHLPHLFERFWRGDASRSRRTGGSGLGLAIAQRIVEAHGGRIWAQNSHAGGLQIGFSLPTQPTGKTRASHTLPS